MGKSVGKILKEEREKQGFSIEDIANTTRIRESYIQSIENDDYGDLGSTYVLGYIRSYALFLEIDAVNLVNLAKAKVEDNVIEYNNPQNYHMALDKKIGLFSFIKRSSIGSSGGVNTKYRDIDSFEKKSGRASFAKYFLVFIGFIVVLVLFLSLGGKESKKDYVESVNIQENQVSAEQTADDKLLEGFTVEEQSEEQLPEEMPKVSSLNTPWPELAGESVISFEFSADSWIRVTSATDANVVYYDSVAKAGSKVAIPNVNENLVFSVGNSQGVTVLVKNKSYEFANKSRKVIRNIPLSVDYIEGNLEIK